MIAGDIFDRAVPPVEAVRLFTDALNRLSAHADVIVIGGNHDSAIRLGYGASLYRPGIHVATQLDEVGTAVPITRNAETVLFYPIPYLDPDHARSALSPSDELLTRSHEAVMIAAMQRIASDRRAREVAGGVEIRYAGSPLRYSFSESAQVKSVTIVDIDSLGVGEITVVPLVQPRGMAVLTGSLADVLSATNQATHSDDWLKIVITDAARPANLQQRLTAAYPHAISIVHQPAVIDITVGGFVTAATLTDPMAISGVFVQDVTNTKATNDEIVVLREAYEAVRAEAGG